jgi:hypothetical protein
MNEEIEKFCLEMQRPPPLSPSLESIASTNDDELSVTVHLFLTFFFQSESELKEMINNQIRDELDSFSTQFNHFFNTNPKHSKNNFDFKNFEKFSISEENFSVEFKQNKQKFNGKTQEKKNLKIPTPIEKPNKMVTTPQKKELTSSPLVNSTSIVSQQSTPTSNSNNLTPNEHKEFLELEKIYLEVQQNPFTKNLYTKQLERFSILKNLVIKEQNEYRRTEYNNALKHKDDYSFIDPTISKQVEEIIEVKKKRILTYPKHYKISQVINLKDLKLEKEDPILSNPQIIQQLGVVNTLEKSFFKKGFSFPLERSIYQMDSRTAHYWRKKTCPDLTIDPVAEDIANQLGISFVLTSSSFSAIVDYVKDFCIPVKIKMVNDKKIIFIDKPFLKKKLTVKEKNTIFYNLAFKSVGIDISSESSKIDFNSNKTAQTYSEFVQRIDNYTYTFWTLGDTKILMRTKYSAVVPDEKKPSVCIYFIHVRNSLMLESKLN